MVKVLKEGEKATIDFAEKKYVFERVNPFFLRISSDGKKKLVSIEKTVEIREVQGLMMLGFCT